MSTWTTRTFFAALFGIAAVTALVAGAAGAATTANTPVIHFPSADAPSLQKAIDDAPDGATILIAPGSYTQRLQISGKRLRIIGSGADRTELLSPSGDQPVVTFVNGGGGELKDVTLRGGLTGVAGVRGLVDLPSAVSLKNLVASDGQAGIYGEFSELEVKNFRVSGATVHGISVLDADSVTIDNGEISASALVGLYLNNTRATLGPALSVRGNPFGGIVASNSDVTMRLVNSSENGHAALALYNGSTASATNSWFNSSTALGGAPGESGHGVLAVDSEAVIVSSAISFNEGIGAYAVNASISLGKSRFSDNTVDFNTEGTSELVDLGGNVCGTNLGGPNEVETGCQVASLGLTAPGPPPPPTL